MISHFKKNNPFLVFGDAIELISTRPLDTRIWSEDELEYARITQTLISQSCLIKYRVCRTGTTSCANLSNVQYAYLRSSLEEQFTLTLNGLEDVEPGGGGVNGTNTTAGYVRVLNSQTQAPKAGVQVQIKVDANANTGGHNHHDANRPKGVLTGTDVVGGSACGPASQPDSCLTFTTDSNGDVFFGFAAPQPAGTHTFTATCISPACTNTASKSIDVKAPGLAPIYDSFFYVLTNQSGVTSKHTDNHHLTFAATNKLRDLAYYFDEFFSTPFNLPKLHVEDASLKWGGKFDVSGDWGGEYDNHRRGTVVNIRANAEVGAIPERFFRFLESTARAMTQRNGIPISAELRCSDGLEPVDKKCAGANRYYELFLLGVDQ